MGWMAILPRPGFPDRSPGDVRDHPAVIARGTPPSTNRSAHGSLAMAIHDACRLGIHPRRGLLPPHFLVHLCVL